MSEHRYPCPAEPPVLTVTDVMIGHRHACVHDAVTHPEHSVVEHRCECRMTWTERIGAMSELELLRQEFSWYGTKVIAVAEALDGLAARSDTAGSREAAWAFGEAAKLVRRIHEQPIAEQP